MNDEAPRKGSFCVYFFSRLFNRIFMAKGNNSQQREKKKPKGGKKK